MCCLAVNIATKGTESMLTKAETREMRKIHRQATDDLAEP